MGRDGVTSVIQSRFDTFRKISLSAADCICSKKN